MANESISDVKAQAVEFFRSGFNCAESVSRAVLAYFKIDSEPICAAAAGFGGVSGATEICVGRFQAECWQSEQ